MAKEDELWEQHWRILFGGANQQTLTWFEAVHQASLQLKAFKSDADSLFWAVEQQHTSLALRIAAHKPRLVTHPSRKDKLPLYTAAQVGTEYVYLPFD